MTRRTTVTAVSILTLLLAGCAASGPGAGRSAPRLLGAQAALGQGTVSSYAELSRAGEPAAIGIVFSRTALEGLPERGSDMHHCFDRNKDGTVDHATECVHTYEHVIPLPDAIARRADVPFKWVLLNWNPAGHIPPGIYDVPHFDVHFYMVPVAEVFAIQSGACGPEFVRCDQFDIARQPLPANYVPADYRNVDAVAPAMGNHLIDVTGPEFNKQPFARSWIYGVYGGKVTFYEEMVTRTALVSRPQACATLKMPEAVATSGFYPSRSCLRHDPATGDVTVSMEGFVLRAASPPGPVKVP